ncbi:MAG TPA: DUF2098 family protein [Candidatus Methanoperedenaceae archaeon]|nr:DUF2098 family protein [Candidatus Methanoperedenaceae archaeon]
MHVVDSAGHELAPGDQVRYEGTGTTGRVKEFLSDEQGTWVVIDTTDLLYQPRTLTFITGSVKEKAEEEAQFTREEMAEAIEKKKESGPHRMDDTSLEAGG